MNLLLRNTEIPECPYNQFLCQDGWCIDYEMKCDGNNDCYYHDDEDYCGKLFVALYLDHINLRRIADADIGSLKSLHTFLNKVKISKTKRFF